MPTRGTTCRKHPFRRRGDFNPRAHEGHDAEPPYPVTIARFQSTCPRGARPHGIIRSPILIHFNPRAHEGHDTIEIARTDALAFQSTCPRGARRRVHGETVQAGDFNPRAHEGHDFMYSLAITRVIFQSTCPRGARLLSCTEYYLFLISIHVPTRGTTFPFSESAIPADFNPRAHEGHDRSGPAGR